MPDGARAERRDSAIRATYQLTKRRELDMHPDGRLFTASLFVLAAGFLTGTASAQTPLAGHTTKPDVQVLQADFQSKARVADAYGKLPLSFAANQGQTDPQVKFLARGAGYR